jgi:hypothetical protein
MVFKARRPMTLRRGGDTQSETPEAFDALHEAVLAETA